jgi:hypothetical protein
MLEHEGYQTCRVKDGNQLITVNVRQILSGIETESSRRAERSIQIHIHGNVESSNLIVGDDNKSQNTTSVAKKPKKR